ncbi:MAG: methylmalonyl-CoA mutase family protein [Phascolarctobacterium sp.]|uniref:methylmalonyl-CoA mutase family protein n=1 Tax=Phascolarctobacterium sp. TaxID=2049039 RepID=UPI0026DB42FA|nr:methylmalonyl-CoA mutase family protein [Phascolarctobacterium sp.]MDO4920454.1 methylmalonyl-CoA mutase family protein [Phascolarctobacterium sp.]
MADEQQKSTAVVDGERPLTDKELEAMLRKSEKVTEFPEVTFDEFTEPTWDEWVEACNALLKGKPFDKIMYTKNYEGITFEPIYTRKVTDPILPTDDYPGMGDFLRGSTVNGYVHEPWGIAQACDETLPSENNELLKEEIAKGSTVYNIKLDSATLNGVDVKDAEKLGDTGVNLTTVEDMSVLLNGLDLKKYPIMIYAGAGAKGMLALTAAALNAAGKDVKTLKGVIGADPIGELVKSGKTATSLSALYDEMAESIKYARANAPELRTVFVNSDVYTNGGADAVQEVAYTFATAVEYVREMQKRGVELHDIAKSLYFCFNQGANFFMEIAKLRALRMIWAAIMQAFGAEEADRAIMVHGRSARFTKTVIDPYVNMLRNCTQTFSSVVGGVNTYDNPPFDELIRKGDVFSRRIARNLHVMLQEEFGMLSPIDAAGGSWGVETLTKQIAEKIWAEFQKIEEKGGIVAALKAGYPQAQVADVLAKRFKALEMRSDRAVGVNMYPNMTEEPLERREEDTPKLKKEREAAVAAYVADIDTNYLAGKLASVETVAGAIEAFSNGATIGQVAAAGCKAEPIEEVEAIAAHHWTERYEALRFDTEKYMKETGKNVEVFLANMGPIPQHKARADFSTSFLQVGEFNVHLNNGFQDDEGKPGSRYEKCVAALKAGVDESGTPYDVAVICSTDATYPEDVPALAPMIKEACPNITLFLAGAAPKDLEPVYKEAGVDDFISVKANCFATLKMLQKKKGMIE